MRRAEQPLPRVIKKLPRLPIELHRHVGAAVQISMRRALVANRKGRAGLSSEIYVEWHGFAAVLQISAVAQRNAGLGHSRIVQQPVVQLLHAVCHKQGLQSGKSLVRMRPKTHPHAGYAGVASKLQIMRRVADHQHARGLDI